MSTASTILGLAFNQLRAEQGGTDLPGLSVSDMLSVLNTVNQEWQDRFLAHSGEPLGTRKSEHGIDLVAATALNGDVASGATSIILDSASDFSSSGGAGAIWDNDIPDIFEWTGKSSNTLSGVSGIGWAHEDDDRVQVFYALPSNFDSFRGEEGNDSGVLYDDRISLVYNSAFPVGFEFSLYDNGTTKYLRLPLDMTGSVRVTFNKTTTTIDEVGDSVDWPSKYDWFGVYRLIAHGKRSRGDPVQRVQYPNGELVDEDDHRADQILLRAQKERNINKGVKVRPLGFKRTMGLYRTNFR